VTPCGSRTVLLSRKAEISAAAEFFFRESQPLRFPHAPLFAKVKLCGSRKDFLARKSVFAAPAMIYFP
jgi:hypothetical protein